MYLKMPNALLEMQLPPNALKVLAVLMSVAGRSGQATVRMAVIAQRGNISRTTVCTAIRQLEAVGLVQRTSRYTGDGVRRANAYAVSLPAGRWFALPVSEEVLSLPAAGFSVYLAMLRFRGGNGRAFPSLSRLASILGLCKNTLLRAIRCLQRSGLLCKMAVWAGKHNLYLIRGMKKRAPGFAQPDAPTKLLDQPSNIFNLTSIWLCVKRAVVHFLNSIPVPTHYATKKRRYT